MDAKIVTQQEMQDVARRLKAADTRLITIVGYDAGDSFQISYFFQPYPAGQAEVYRVIVPKHGGNEEVESITHIFPAAYIAENEAAEMFGIRVKDVPGRFFLPDSITAPLRRKAP
ncbi:MAG TPA: NADH-quinone oxidoreductase subunit C [Methanocella sp.]|jgi:ech hydrogenase subunit D